MKPEKLRFEWDPKKALRNARKHGISFAEGKTVFRDPLFLIAQDPDHSIGEHRYVIMGEFENRRLLVVAYTEMDEGLVRLISARQATRKERRAYEDEI